MSCDAPKDYAAFDIVGPSMLSWGFTFGPAGSTFRGTAGFATLLRTRPHGTLSLRYVVVTASW